MVSKIIHQIWNERRQNILKMAVLLLTTIFIWMIADPIYVIMATKAIPKNIEKRDRYCIQVDFDFHELISDEDNGRLYDVVRNIYHNALNLPEVENYIKTSWTGEPDASSFCYHDIYRSRETKEQKTTTIQYNYFWEGNKDMFATLGLKDANSGGTLTVPERIDVDRGMFISRSAAMSLFGSTDVVGKRTNDLYDIVGVYEDFNNNEYIEPVPTSIMLYLPNIYNISVSSCKCIVKLKEGTDINMFARKIEEIRAKTDKGNETQIKVLTYDELLKESHNHKQVAFIIRQKVILSSFALFCIFLCMLGTFWVRMDNRRSDIGIMRSMGASRSRVVRQYITEAVILLTVAFIVALPLILHIVLVDGFAEPAVCTLNKNAFPPNPEYGVNNTYIHFAWVTAITFIAMLAITVIGTFIPVYRATRILPADALRDE